MFQFSFGNDTNKSYTFKSIQKANLSIYKNIFKILFKQKEI